MTAKDFMWYILLILAKIYVFLLAEVKILFRKLKEWIFVLSFGVKKRLVKKSNILMATLYSGGRTMNVTYELQCYIAGINDYDDEFNLYEFIDFVKNFTFTGKFDRLQIYWLKPSENEFTREAIDSNINTQERNNLLISNKNTVYQSMVFVNNGTLSCYICTGVNKKALFNNIKLSPEYAVKA